MPGRAGGCLPSLSSPSLISRPVLGSSWVSCYSLQQPPFLSRSLPPLHRPLDLPTAAPGSPLPSPGTCLPASVHTVPQHPAWRGSFPDLLFDTLLPPFPSVWITDHCGTLLPLTSPRPAQLQAKALSPAQFLCGAARPTCSEPVLVRGCCVQGLGDITRAEDQGEPLALPKPWLRPLAWHPFTVM